jgi:hypothetical protein
MAYCDRVLSPGMQSLHSYLVRLDDRTAETSAELRKFKDEMRSRLESNTEKREKTTDNAAVRVSDIEKRLEVLSFQMRILAYVGAAIVTGIIAIVVPRLMGMDQSIEYIERQQYQERE